MISHDLPIISCHIPSISSYSTLMFYQLHPNHAAFQRSSLWIYDSPQQHALGRALPRQWSIATRLGTPFIVTSSWKSNDTRIEASSEAPSSCSSATRAVEQWPLNGAVIGWKSWGIGWGNGKDGKGDGDFGGNWQQTLRTSSGNAGGNTKHVMMRKYRKNAGNMWSKDWLKDSTGKAGHQEDIVSQSIVGLYARNYSTTVFVCWP